ncbi:MAG: pilin [Wohlfahrtiimonas sp.]
MKSGFTLIELMIVVAIIGILSMIALPAYQDYTKRTYVSEGLALSAAAKMAATETFATTGLWPTKNSEAGLPNGNQITGAAVQSI